MKMKNVLAAIILLMAVLAVDAQYRAPRSKPGNSLSDRIYFGGGGGFSGGNQYINVAVSPLIGYKFTDQFSGGLQITYQYVRFIDISASNYGGGPFLRYNFTPKFFGYTQYEYLNYLPLGATNSSENRYHFNSWFVGIGYSEPLGDRAAFNIMALYNLLHQDGRSPYRSPLLFRVGFAVGLF